MRTYFDCGLIDVGVIVTRAEELNEIIPLIEACSLPNRIELFARGDREGWDMWGNQADPGYEPTWNTYKNHTVAAAK